MHANSSMAVLLSISAVRQLFLVIFVLTLSHLTANLGVNAASTTADRDGGDVRKELSLLLITSYGRFGYNSSGTLPAADIALETINNRTDILPGYKLVYGVARDSEVSAVANSMLRIALIC